MIISKFLSYNLQALLGKKVNNRIVIIESDDWGFIRVPTKTAFDQLQASGIPVHTCPYNTYDALETKEDIAILHEFCSSFKDFKGNPLQITANFIMANPDFDAIKDSDYEKYHYHDLSITYLKHQGEQNTLKAIKEAYQLGTFMPQLHGREHLQVNHWLSALRQGDVETCLAFEAGVFGHPSAYAKKTGVNFLSAFHISSLEELAFSGQSVLEAGSLFRNTFGITSKTFIAPRYIWPVELESYFKQAGIEALQGTIVQLRPKIGSPDDKLTKRINWMGRGNSHALNYLTRNVFFEPTQNPDFPWEADALRRIETAFFWGKPAIISMHRLNFVGGFSRDNRMRSMQRLEVLITQVQKKYRDVIFSTSSKFYNM
jgi:hypothetical protein